jgi:hypothetical protein
MLKMDQSAHTYLQPEVKLQSEPKHHRLKERLETKPRKANTEMRRMYNLGVKKLDSLT